jgi:hypothetical protein
MTLRQAAMLSLATATLVALGMCVGVLVVRASLDPLLKLESRPSYAETAP